MAGWETGRGVAALKLPFSTTAPVASLTPRALVGLRSRSAARKLSKRRP